MASDPREETYHRFVAAVEADPGVLGLVLTGSRGRGAFVRPESDWDVHVVVREGAATDAARRHGPQRGGPVESVFYTLAEFEQVADPGTSTAWDRYSYVDAEVVIDKLDGGIARLVAQKARLDPVTARAMAAYELDGYINSYYRALKNERLGLTAAARLDAAESIEPLLIALFAMHDRVRPFNKLLTWELERRPLPGETWAVDRLVPRLLALLDGADAAAQALLFRDVEALAREHGLGDVVDEWAPDVDLLRGERPEEA
jgi:hypothetical protein